MDHVFDFGISQSDSVVEISKALADAYGNFENTLASAQGAWQNSYSPLSEVVASRNREVLAKHGLFIFQAHGRYVTNVVHQTNDENPELVSVSSYPCLITRLGHKSGEWMEFRSPIPTDKNDPQGFVGGNTYMRRATNSMILNTASETDDDGTYSSHRASGRKSQSAPKAKTSGNSETKASKPAKVKMEFDEPEDSSVPVGGDTSAKITAELSMSDWNHVNHFENHVRKHWDEYKGRLNGDQDEIESLSNSCKEMKEMLGEREVASATST